MIAVTEIYERFLLYIDKFEDDSVTPDEFNRFLNMALEQIVDNYYNNAAKQQQTNGRYRYVYEHDSNLASMVRDLVVSATGTLTAPGELTIAEIDALPELANTGMYRVLRFEVSPPDDDNFYSCDYIRHNDLSRIKDNYYHIPRSCSPVHTIEKDRYAIYPNDIQYDYDITVMQRNVQALYDPITPANNVDVNMAPEVTNNVVFKMAELFGINTENQSLYQSAINSQNTDG